jgi:hypothetical protein
MVEDDGYRGQQRRGEYSAPLLPVSKPANSYGNSYGEIFTLSRDGVYKISIFGKKVPFN